MLIWMKDLSWSPYEILLTNRIEETGEYDDDGYEFTIIRNTYIDLIEDVDLHILSNKWHCGTPVLF